MIKPLLSGDALLRDIRNAAADVDHLHLWWLGQSGFLAQYAGSHLLLDPYLSDSLTRKYAHTDKPHQRMTEIPIDPARLDFIDVATSSHSHTDHLDADTLRPLLRHNPRLQLLVPAANQALASERLEVPLARLTTIDDRQTVVLDKFVIHAIPAAHETVERDDQGRCRYLGYLIQAGPWSIYHSGDTVLFPGLAERLAAFEIDVAILPINGRSPERRVAGNLWGREAAELAQAVHARVVIPCHFDMFSFNTETPDEFIATAQRLGQPYRILLCGERWTSSELDPPVGNDDLSAVDVADNDDGSADIGRAPEGDADSEQRVTEAGEMVVAETYASRMEAEFAVRLLESAKIHALLDVDDGGGVYAGLTLSSHGPRLLVWNRDLPAALAILHSSRSSNDASAETHRNRPRPGATDSPG